MTDRSAVYFPLRSNASALIAGAAIASVRRRIQVASLLHDEVYIEDGEWIGQAGPTGSMSVWHPPNETKPARWQTPRERGAAERSGFYVAMGPSDAPLGTPLRRVLESDTTRYWRATFEPFKHELGRNREWVTFGTVPDHPLIKRLADDRIRRDERDSRIQVLWPEQFVRSLVVKSANHDLVAAASIDAAVSMDSRHAQIARLNVLRGTAIPIHGARAFEAVVPDVARLSWDDIENLRRHPDIDHFRREMAEIEWVALESARSATDLEASIHHIYESRVRDAYARLEGSFRDRLLRVAIGLVAGMAGTIPGMIVSGVDFLRGELSRSRWLTFDCKMRERIERV